MAAMVLICLFCHTISKKCRESYYCAIFHNCIYNYKLFTSIEKIMFTEFRFFFHGGGVLYKSPCWHPKFFSIQ